MRRGFMSEYAWRNDENVIAMLLQLGNEASGRKLMLFDVGFERLFDPDRLDGRAEQFLQMMETWAEDPEQRRQFRDPSWNWSPERLLGWFRQEERRLAGPMTRGAADLLRCVFANPFKRLLVIRPEWQTENVLRLARSIYEERVLPRGTLDPTRLVELAGRLEQIGCTRSDLQEHLREARQHIRGCWAIDLILGKK